MESPDKADGVKWEIIPENDSGRRYCLADRGLKIYAFSPADGRAMVLRMGNEGQLNVVCAVRAGSAYETHIMTVSPDDLPAVVQENLGCTVPDEIQSAIREAFSGVDV